MSDRPEMITVPTSTINVHIPIADLKQVRDGYLVHPTETRGPARIPIVVRTSDWSVLDPDDEGRFQVGRMRLTFSELIDVESTSFGRDLITASGEAVDYARAANAASEEE